MISIVEVGPRDGLQNEKKTLELEDKFLYIEGLIHSGVKRLEVTSFVRPEAIPQMADAKELFSKVKEKFSNDELDLICLVPNKKGLESALEVGVNSVALFSAVSNSFNQKNINTDIEGSFKRFDEILPDIKKHQLKVRGYLSCVFGCPYEGKTDLNKAVELTQRFLDLGASEVSLGDTIGIGHPGQVRELLDLLVKKNIDLSKIALHFHDTFGRALANISEGYRLGIRTFDSSAGGLGGCPYANGASGNVATEDVLDLFQVMEETTGIDSEKLSLASMRILSKLEKQTTSKVLQAIMNKGN